MGSPSLIDGQGDQILERLNALTEYASNHILGGVITDGGTTQATGANTAPNLDLDVSALSGSVAGVPVNAAAATDVDATAGDTVVWGATSGKSVKTAVVVKQDGTYEIVPGAVAATGSEVAPTDAAIDAVVGSGLWALVGHVTFNRTGDLTITVTPISYAARSAVNFPSPLAVSEAAFRAVS